MTVLNLIRPELLNCPSYALSGEQALHRLHANELPWTPISMDQIQLNHYPDTNLELKLKDQLARCYQINSNQLTITRGGDDAIDYLTRIFLTARKDALMQFSPTFSMYSYYVRLQQGELIDCPLAVSDDFSISFERLKQYWQSNCKIIMFCNPNNPTANSVDLDLIALTCKTYSNQSVVVVDEAYIEFAQDKSALCLLSQFENLILLRTLSKAHGLAGLRLGAIIAQEHVIEAINRVIPPYIHSSPSLALSSKAIEQSDWVNKVLTQLIPSRTYLIEQLKQIICIKKVYPSETNFILVQSDFAYELAQFLDERSISVRTFSPTSVLHDHLRITVGSDEQNKQLIDSIALFNQQSQEKP
ncbi:histidinol-phosphate transaminase [Legionella waltersii]|uniref:histidinol-phosphate transaminase n=1 Tax=Legionella waltersii TaxID=66969 RepID=A0A0W1AMX7_9GAMM|nr:histidinol-phosphate transaminase [Legionella waltersii]KTD82689.1 histidinol-phosphate aminotransferase (imidazole acetol-phosphate transaminase) [Legionella waltersii]SNV03318.1 histidinol-phosphate aminotransferase [Legionella waltersii]